MKKPVRIAAWIASSAAAMGAIACHSHFSVASPDGPPFGRKLPAAVDHVAAGSVLLLSCECTATSSATLINGSWMRAGAEVRSLDQVCDGAIVNNGPDPVLCLRLDDGIVVELTAGESLLVGPAVGGYTQGCLCKCGEGTIFIAKETCNGTCSNCDGWGPCLDPVNHQEAAGFTGCKNGWGPASN